MDELFCDMKKENFSTFKNVELCFSPHFPWQKPNPFTFDKCEKCGGFS
ncbi:MAG: hypothetical protein SVE93_04425 [Candidatus Thermoplasmatota archaeon]|nr:hypothetical protein [Candidatus Thermoplasmatota archaeon]